MIGRSFVDSVSRPHEATRHRIHHAKRRSLLALALFVGLAAGFLAVGFQAGVHEVETLARMVALFAREHGFIGLSCLLMMGCVAGGFSGWLTEKFAPEAGGSGIPHVKAVLMSLRILEPLRLVPVKIVAGLSALLSGMSLGREGPTIQIGAAIGQMIAKVSRTPKKSHSTLISAGAGAGLAAAFNAPLAGFIFVMEELKREMSPLTYGAALIASVSSVAVTRIWLGQSTSFLLENPSPIPIRLLPIVVVVGLLCGIVAVFFNRLTLGLIHVREKLKISRLKAGAVVGVLAASFLVLLPQATGGGHRLAEDILDGRIGPGFTIGLAILILFSKILLTSSSFATGVPGGIFAPILVIGALVGNIVGSVAAVWFPGLPVPPSVFATIGMVAALSGSVRAPLTGVVLIVEMTGEYSLLYALLIGAFASYAVAELLRDKPIYEALLENELHRTGELGTLPKATTPVEVMIEPDSYLDGRLIRHLNLPSGFLIVTIERDGGFIVPGGSTKLRSGDHLTVLVGPEKQHENLATLYDAAKAP